MTKENKQLLLTDLCARLPYHTICHITNENGTSIDDILTTSTIQNLDIWWDVKPYLREMSSMTEEEREDFWLNVLDLDWVSELDLDDEEETIPFPFTENYCGFYFDNFCLRDSVSVVDWLNANHFDYRGLIEKGLAIKVIEENNPYK